MKKLKTIITSFILSALILWHIPMIIGQVLIKEYWPIVPYNVIRKNDAVTQVIYLMPNKPEIWFAERDDKTGDCVLLVYDYKAVHAVRVGHFFDNTIASGFLPFIGTAYLPNVEDLVSIEIDECVCVYENGIMKKPDNMFSNQNMRLKIFKNKNIKVDGVMWEANDDEADKIISYALRDTD